jgi:UDP-2,3-diacylglucosamine hydrolase
VAKNYVLAVEAAEGTDAMLARCAGLREIGRIKQRARSGVLVKAPKPGQEERVDLPTIGPETVRNAAAAGLAGIAVAAGRVLMAEHAATIAAANRHGLFLVGERLTDEGGA